MTRGKQAWIAGSKDKSMAITKMLKHLLFCSLGCVVCPVGARTCEGFSSVFTSKPFVRPVRLPCVRLPCVRPSTVRYQK
jgi:hypothetical protein